MIVDIYIMFLLKRNYRRFSSMRSSFAKSIYFGAAVLGLAGLSAVTTTTASARTKTG